MNEEKWLDAHTSELGSATDVGGASAAEWLGPALASAAAPLMVPYEAMVQEVARALGNSVTAVMAERERCAKKADDHVCGCGDHQNELAADIRSGE